MVKVQTISMKVQQSTKGFKPSMSEFSIFGSWGQCNEPKKLTSQIESKSLGLTLILELRCKKKSAITIISFTKRY